MKKIKILEKKRGKVVSDNILIADSFFNRLKGLMFLKKFDGFNGLLIKRCNSVHTFFMKFNIDIIFINSNFEIIEIKRNVPPWRLTKIYFKANQVLELMGNTLPLDISKGDKLEVVCIS